MVAVVRATGIDAYLTPYPDTRIRHRKWSHGIDTAYSVGESGWWSVAGRGGVLCYSKVGSLMLTDSVMEQFGESCRRAFLLTDERARNAGIGDFLEYLERLAAREDAPPGYWHIPDMNRERARPRWKRLLRKVVGHG